ncbi:hypothetical protein PR048_009950 [Dryococelus australis]|uniref:Uncharacterized protein n=1 Tax=Dryococelus australis TaxID=614101 RepID=A0ABQ9I1D2_9NEOP|nr:hypothetical protein PR048_009950 [Dryococelus australis]
MVARTRLYAIRHSCPCMYNHKHCSIPEEVTESVVHISSLKGRQSHCSRKNSERVYLPDTLNINRMKIFNTRFNIAFGYPRSDTFSSCDKYQADVRALQHTLSGPSLPDKEKYKIETHMRTAQVANKVHKRKAAVFYERKRTARQRSMKNESHEAITFDFHKNLPMHKITTNDVYYRWQLSLYSFNIHTLSTGDSIFYCYPETEGRKGSDEVTSFLHHFIFNLLDPKVKDIELFCDASAGQNKNYTVLWFLHYVVHATRRLDRIKLTFPVSAIII